MSQAEQDLAIIKRCEQAAGSGFLFNPLLSHGDCQVMIDEIRRHGLWKEFCDTLIRHYALPDSFTHYDVMQIALTATPRQKTMAALEVLERKE